MLATVSLLVREQPVEPATQRQIMAEKKAFRQSSPVASRSLSLNPGMSPILTDESPCVNQNLPDCRKYAPWNRILRLHRVEIFTRAVTTICEVWQKLPKWGRFEE